jgi:hypothetical protein
MNVEIWHLFVGVGGLLVGIGGLLTPIVLAAKARDTSLLTMIAAVKHDSGKMVQAATEPIHERINRVRDEFVRRDDLDGHLARIDKQFDAVHSAIQRGNDEIKGLIRGGRQPV